MKSKKILIVSRSFYPMNSPRSFRTTELAKEFSSQGHEVTVLTPKTSEHIAFEKEHNMTIEDLGQPKWKEIQLKGRGIPLFVRRGLRRVLQMLFQYPNMEYFFKVKRALKKNEKHYDLLISIAVPYAIHWGVASVWKKKNNIAKRWVADCGDPFMGGENDTFKPAFYFEYIEKWFCKKVDHLSVPVKTAVQAYYPEFQHKIKVIPQGFKFEEIKLAPKIKNECTHFAYAGGLIPGRREPKEFLEFLVNYPHPYKFDIYTKQSSLIKSYVERSKGRMELKDYMPRKDLLFELSKLDFVVNFENAGQKQIPSKIIDYIIIKKPILSVNSLAFNPQPVKEFLAGNYQNGLTVENPEQYRIENVVKEFLSLASS